MDKDGKSKEDDEVVDCYEILEMFHTWDNFFVLYFEYIFSSFES